MEQEVKVVKPEVKETVTEQEVRDITSLPSDELESYLAQEGGSETVVEPELEAKKEETVIAPEVSAEPEKKEGEPEVVETELEKLNRQLKDKETFIQRQANEIGELRKHRQALDTLSQTLPKDEQAHLEALNELAVQNPVEFQKQWASYQAKKQEEQRIVNEMQFMEKVSKTRETALTFVPNFETELDDIAAVLEQDGLPAEAIQEFKTRPFANDPGTLINLSRRAALNKENTALKQQIETLKKENDELRKKPDSILKKIETASKSKPMTGSTGGADGTKDSYLAKPIPKMTSEELNQFLATPQ